MSTGTLPVANALVTGLICGFLFITSNNWKFRICVSEPFPNLCLTASFFSLSNNLIITSET